jgi:exopolysaccharide biosynthesis polyprenyl glycosylphosphotransferase
VPVLDVADKPIDGWDSLVKSMEDQILGILILLLSLPLLLIIAALVKLDSPGSIFFRQMRSGFNNQPIEVLKFRTLYVDSQDESAETLVTRDDPRVTRIGAFLRRSSLDELPQIFNVLKGEMSIVGPRPHAYNAKAAGRYYQNVVVRYAARHKVKPGITGWAQVNGWRGETDTVEKIMKRVEYDLYYIENWSIMFDLRIIFKTFFALLRKENAY